MKARAIFTLLLAALLGFAASAGAQESAADKPAADEPSVDEPSADEQEKSRRNDPTTGALPVEDPTIHQERNEQVRAQKEQNEQKARESKSAPKSEAEDSSDAETEAEAEAEAEAEPTTGGLPVEDPTIQTPSDGEGDGEPGEEPGDTPGEAPAEKPSEEPEPAESDAPQLSEGWSDNVKVHYDYRGGLIVGVDDWFYLTVAGLVQARYTVNYRTDPPTDPDTLEREKQVSQGFDMARARFQLGIGLTEFVALYMRIGVVAGGDFSFQRAFIDLKWKWFRIRAGLFMNETIAESLINPNDHYFIDYSIVENVYTPGSSKGVMFTYLRRRFSINLGYSDGLRTGFSEIRDPTRADFAVTLRAQYAWGKNGLGGFNRLISRRGTPFGVRLAAAAHYQDGGRSQGSADVKIGIGTVDLSVRGSGWSALLSVTAGQDANAPTATTPGSEVVTTGISLMGGYFVLDDLHVFGQYSIVAKPKIEGAPPPTVPGADLNNLSSFQSFGVGFSYFVIPGNDNVKLSSDFQYFLGYEAGSTVPSSPLNSIQPNSAGSQFAWRIQISAAF